VSRNRAAAKQAIYATFGAVCYQKRRSNHMRKDSEDFREYMTELKDQIMAHIESCYIDEAGAELIDLGSDMQKADERLEFIAGILIHAGQLLEQAHEMIYGYVFIELDDAIKRDDERLEYWNGL
jgi:hypothetical protein